MYAAYTMYYETMIRCCKNGRLGSKVNSGARSKMLRTICWDRYVTFMD